jgi:AcrR family transcriptional regulator
VSVITSGYDGGVAPGLRERRKQQTRQVISDIATRMFAARGFDEVTISQVAGAAGVAKMTVTNYFPRKEDLVFDRAEEIIGHLARVVAAREPGESMLAAIRRDYADMVARADVTLGLSSPGFVRMIQDSPVLTSRALEIQHLREQALGDAIAAETGTDGPQQRLVAALLASVHRVLNAEASRRSLAGEPRAEICAVLADAANRAFDLLEPAIGSYGIRGHPGGTGQESTATHSSSTEPAAPASAAAIRNHGPSGS